MKRTARPRGPAPAGRGDRYGTATGRERASHIGSRSRL
ncbi:hypothetical protein FTUN_0901 [Frigoriglobus tundricola]|uniref:Uncharacterized protein n=1 Tax=Frigoriglobus tundricola TaxID=2774151 RepID=A0A6M5YH67_9BACT|nr:hypothetical protein FTUN_0901 [Frigoriglobus tundricola]